MNHRFFYKLEQWFILEKKKTEQRLIFSLEKRYSNGTWHLSAEFDDEKSYKFQEDHAHSLNDKSTRQLLGILSM